MTITQKLDRAYDVGVIAVVCARTLIIPVRARADIRETCGIIEIHFADHWIPVPPNRIKFVRLH